MKTTLWANRLISDVVEDKALACTVGKKGWGKEGRGLFSTSALLSQTMCKAVQSWRISVPIIFSKKTELLLFLFLPTEICSFAGQELSAEMCLAQLELLITTVKETIKNNICAHQ